MQLRYIECAVLLGFVIIFIAQACNNSTSFVSSAETKLKILAVLAHLGKSHFDVFKPLLEELARRGHELTVISHFPRSHNSSTEEYLPNYKDISLVDSRIGVFVNVVDLQIMDHSSLRLFKNLKQLWDMGTLACEICLRNPGVQRLIRSDETFDLILTETFNTDCFLGFVHRFKAPFLGISSHQIMPWTSASLNICEEYSEIPITFLGFQRPMNLFERLQNIVSLAVARIIYDTLFLASAQSLANEIFGPGVPNLRDIAKNMSGLLVNTHYSLHGTRSLPVNVYEIGGLHIPQKRKSLPRDIADFLDSAQDGVVYFNMGSMIKGSSFPTDKLEAVLKVFRSIPRKVIWKFEIDELPGKPDNVMVRKWLPQFDVLNHPNVKCYLGHGGLLGLSEGVYVGVPMILIPIYGDQFHNAAAAATRGVAIVLDYDRLDERNLRESIDEIFNNTIYRENAEKLSRVYRDRPMSPLETAVWFTEHIAKNDAQSYLRNEGIGLPWYHRYFLNVVFFFIPILFICLYFFVRIIWSAFMIRFIKDKNSMSNKKKSKSIKNE